MSKEFEIRISSVFVSGRNPLTAVAASGVVESAEVGSKYMQEARKCIKSRKCVSHTKCLL